MKKLRNSFVVSLLVFFSCQTTKNFQIITDEKEELHVVKVSADRVIQECYFMNAEKENNWRHQYLVYILDNKNEVITAMNPTNQDDTQCDQQKNKIEKILKNAKSVKFCLRDKLIRDMEHYPDTYDFGKLGKHKGPYGALMFDTVCNHKECYSISDTWTTTCSDFKSLDFKMNPKNK